MSEIQNEYALVIKAIGNILDEKAFLRSKINKLMVEHATRDALETERARIVDLVAAWDVASRWKRLIELQTTKEELAFVSRVGDLFPLELSKKQPEKRRKDLQYLGRWHFVKDWVEERAQTCPVLMQLSEKLKQNPAVYKRLFPEDEGIGAHEYDAPEVRKLKHHVEEQRRISRNYAKELAAVNEKYRVLYAQINNVDERIKEVSELLSTRFGAVRTVDSDEPNDRESAVQ
nr:hypothetical protein HK105_006247 [Polyrhizophydium stewartii]